MKIKNLIITACALATFFSCQREHKTDLQAICGSYTGYTLAEFSYAPLPLTAAGQTLELAKKTETSLVLEYTSADWGTFRIEDIQATEAAGHYTLQGSGEVSMGMDPENVKTYACHLEGTLNPGKSDSEFIFRIPEVMGGMTITFRTGEIPAGLAVTGFYKGTLDLSVAGNSLGTIEDHTVTVDGREEPFSLVLKGFGAGGAMNLSDIEIKPVSIAREGDSYRMEGDIDAKSGELSVKGSFSGTVSGKTASLVFEIIPGAMPMPVTVTFNGTR